VLRVALRNVLAHKARLLMTMLAVLLGTAFVAGTLVFTDSISDAYRRSSQHSFDQVDVQVRSDATGDAATNARLLDQRLLDAAAALPGAASATGVLSGFTALAGKDGQVIGEGRTTLGANHAGEADPRYPMVDGRPPRTEGEIAVDAATAERGGYAVGDTVRVSVSGPVLQPRITGIFSTVDGNVAAGGTLTLFDTDTAQTLFARPGSYNRIDLTAEPGVSPEQLRADVGTLLPPGVEAVTAAELAAEQADANAASVTALSQVLLACAGIALFVGIFLIANTFNMLAAQRTRELALLRAVGATRGQVTRSVLIEAALVGLVASAAGLVTGAAAAAGLRAVLSTTDSTLPEGPLVVDATAVIASLTLGLGVTMYAAWLPARRAARIPPVAAMSSLHTPATTRTLAVRNAIGATLAAGGGALVFVAIGRADEVMLALGAVLLLIGCLVLTPLLSRPAIAAAGPALRWFGVSGRLAGQNALRSPRRTAATAAALTIGLMLITGLTVIGTSAERAIRELAGSDYLRADYTVTMANEGPLAPDTERRVSEVDGVTAVSPRRVTRARIDGVDQEVIGFRTDVIDQLLGLDFLEGSSVPGHAVVDRDTAAAHGWRVGDSLPVVWPDGAHGALTITGIYRSTFDDGVRTDIAVMDPHLDRIAATAIFVKTGGGPSEQTKRALQRALGDSPAIRIADKDDLVEELTGAVGVVLTILYGMLALAVVVAVLGVVNTLAMSVHERVREIGLLRAVGLDRSGVKRMIRLEAVVISLFGGVLGIALGILLGWAVGDLAATREGIATWTLVLPWGRLAIFLGAAALVGVLAAVGPARRAARLNLLAAINTE
jgi:putative ABC transport system permease protein